ncbi:hypothetical protein H696_02910 [Fonticula alba]|uniref:G-protein coupled receptors family 3 profile domain-containing protein n=1 Tax=Fonticula alba TaxID=691883 RepID=A0A058Z8J4_FONAL|nr:hypothetical protein H696_02910 [Fonticula alba]KCV70565.1 hypothetical protein H696_02910 [Fonticula alba]|eukprot:XP_009495081.1 hypothetical protein H696_02910 [Fonticula alba]
MAPPGRLSHRAPYTPHFSPRFDWVPSSPPLLPSTSLRLRLAPRPTPLRPSVVGFFFPTPPTPTSPSCTMARLPDPLDSMGFHLAEKLVVAFAGLVIGVSLIAILFTLYHRNWPPIKAKQPSLMFFAWVGGSCFLIGTLYSNRVFPVIDGFKGCAFFHYWIQVPMGVSFYLTACFYRLLRIYLIFKARHLHTTKFIIALVAAIYLPFIIFGIVYTIFEWGGPVDIDGYMICLTPILALIIKFSLIGMQVICLTTLTFMTRSIRHKVFSEYNAVMNSMLVHLVAFVLFTIISMLGLQFTLWGRCLLGCLVSVVIVVNQASIIYVPLYHRIVDPEEYLAKFQAQIFNPSLGAKFGSQFSGSSHPGASGTGYDEHGLTSSTSISETGAPEKGGDSPIIPGTIIGGNGISHCYELKSLDGSSSYHPHPDASHPGLHEDDTAYMVASAAGATAPDGQSYYPSEAESAADVESLPHHGADMGSDVEADAHADPHHHHHHHHYVDRHTPEDDVEARVTSIPPAAGASSSSSDKGEESDASSVDIPPPSMIEETPDSASATPKAAVPAVDARQSTSSLAASTRSSVASFSSSVAGGSDGDNDESVI